ncbi:hypothetical protein [uncultured Tenacibaculum sp.]|uniref:hypothetical protein n=1 Tax=uncultured Tenacibaculum sp. TaxID=174713 RepID=UPI00260729BE|nr:hypothetical protein [uncultured Tenacibaculum sp.]
MKLKLTALCLVIGCIAFCQKQIQPYTFTKEGKTILIYASAKSANNITFSLKNEKNLSFKNKEGENISFDVSPFIETIFKSKLKEAITAINSYEGKEDDKVTSENEIVNLEDYEKETRNIYQFFNALIITAFQYDTEPVAGTLKYALDVNITKISGSTDFYKLARCIDNKKKSDLDTANFKNPDFVAYIKNNKFDELKKFERHEIRKILKKEYNANRIKKLLENNLLSEYIETKRKIRDAETEITKIKERNKRIEEKVTIHKDSIENIIVKLKSKIAISESRDEIIKRIKIQEKKRDSLQNLINSNTARTIEQPSNLNKEGIIQYRKKIKDQIKVLQSQKESVLEKLASENSRYQEIKNVITKNKTLSEELFKADKRLDSLKQKGTDTVKRKLKELKISKDSLIIVIKDQIIDIPLFEYRAENIQLDINNGFIEHITMTGKVKQAYIPESLVWKNYIDSKPKDYLSYEEIKQFLNEFYKEPLVKDILEITDKELKFVNAFPLGFSSRTDFDDLHNYELTYYEGREAIFSIPVTDVIKMYVQKHQNDRLDFSPKNQTISLPQDDLNKEFSLELKKEKSSKILGARFFSDFIGLNEADPNGLIQVEIEKLIPLWTRRYLIRGSRGRNVGWVNYVKPSFNWARIEDREEELTLSNNTISYLDLIRYKNTSIGFDLNAFTFDVPNSKLRFELNGGVHYGRTRVINTSTQFNENVGFFNVYPEVKVRIRPEERFGGALIYRPNKILIPKGDDFNGFSTVQNDGQWLHGIELSTFYTPNINSDNKFFFRYRYTNTANQETNGFSQFQVGYLAYLKF